MDQHKNYNPQIFDEEERSYIKILIARRDVLQEYKRKQIQNKKQNMTIKQFAELQALNWVLNLLEEISEE